MIFDVALVITEAEQDFHIWHLNIERFKLPAQGWTESLWQPDKPKSGSPEAQEIEKHLDSPCLPFLQEHIKVQPGSLLQRNHNSPEVCFWDRNYGNRGLHFWQSEQKFPTFGTCWGGRLAVHQLWTKQFEKRAQCPNILIRKLFKVCSTLFISIKHSVFSLFNFSSSTGSYSLV